MSTSFRFHKNHNAHNYKANSNATTEHWHSRLLALTHTLPCNRKWYRRKCVYIYMLLDVKYRITNTVAPIKRTKRLNIKATETEWIKKRIHKLKLANFSTLSLSPKMHWHWIFNWFDVLWLWRFEILFFLSKNSNHFCLHWPTVNVHKMEMKRKKCYALLSIFFLQMVPIHQKKIWNVSMQISQKPISFLSLYLLPWKLIVRTASIVATATEYSVITTTKLDNS